MGVQVKGNFPGVKRYYNYGNEHADITGGWVSVTERGTPTFNKQQDYLEIVANTRSSGDNDDIGYYFTNNRIDLTGIRRLEFMLYADTTGGTLRLLVSTSKSYSGALVVTEGIYPFRWEIAKLNFAFPLNGSYYIGFGAVNEEGKSDSVIVRARVVSGVM